MLPEGKNEKENDTSENDVLEKLDRETEKYWEKY
jgi:hypothetical protein